MSAFVLEGRVAVALALVLVATVSDLRHRLIPDWVSIGLLALFLLPNLVEGRWLVIGEAAAVAAGVFLVGALCFRMGWTGGGDVKLMTALAFWAGPSGLLTFVLLTSIAGGILSLFYVGRAFVLRWTGQAGASLDTIELPYGVAIAVGGVPLILAAL